MTCRTQILFLAFLCSLPEIFATELSFSTNGVYLAVAGWRHDSIGIVTNGSIRFDDALIFLTFCDTGKVEISYPLDPAYGVKIKMTNPAGKEVAKTSLGKKFGSKFDRLHASSTLGHTQFWLGGHIETTKVWAAQGLSQIIGWVRCYLI